MPSPGTTVEAAVGAAAPIFKRGAKVYRLSPLRIGDFARLNAYLKALPLDAIKFHLADAPPDLARYLLRLLYASVEAAIFDLQALSPATWAAAMDTWAGRPFALYLSLRREHPDLEFADVETMIDEKNWEEVGDLLDVITGFGRFREKKGDPRPGPGAGLGGFTPPDQADTGRVRGVDDPAVVDPGVPAVGGGNADPGPGGAIPARP